MRYGSDSDLVMRNSGRSVFIEQRKSRPPSYQFEDENGYGLQCRTGWLFLNCNSATTSTRAALSILLDL
jgi:hypothetical protein